MLKLSRADHWIGLYPNKTHCTLVLVATSQGKCRLLTLAQSFSLSLMATTLSRLRSSLHIRKFTLVIPDQDAQHLHLQLPPDIPPAERCATLSWLIEQQGFSPLDAWLWDAVVEPDADHFTVLLYEREAQQNLLQGLALRASQLSWVADARATVPAQEHALQLLAQAENKGPWLNLDALTVTTAAILIASGHIHA